MNKKKYENHNHAKTFRNASGNYVDLLKTEWYSANGINQIIMALNSMKERIAMFICDSV